MRGTSIFFDCSFWEKCKQRSAWAAILLFSWLLENLVHLFIKQSYGSTRTLGWTIFRCSESSLSACTVSTVLVGEMSSVARSGLVSSLIHSTLRLVTTYISW